MNVKQAVVVIHGIGEQIPMDTVRGFVSVVSPIPKDPNKPRFWSKPDPMSELFELRKLTTPQSKDMPPTDYFEYYWAYQAEGTKIAHIIAWAWSLLVRRPGNVPKHLKPLWWTLWGLLAGALGFYASGYWGQLSASNTRASYLLSLLFTAAGFVISGFVINYVGDAARYLNPSPTNIKMRRNIRQQGVELLKKLHEPEYAYDRIVVVGHSLGSVIAYDIIRHLWPQFNQRDEHAADVRRLHGLRPRRLSAGDRSDGIGRCGSGWRKSARKTAERLRRRLPQSPKGIVGEGAVPEESLARDGPRYHRFAACACRAAAGAQEERPRRTRE